ncbi:MAG: DMT family transporter [Thermoguttaceae bacterium]
MSKPPSLFLAFTFAVFNAVIIGLSFMFAKVAVTTAGVIDTLTWRFVIAFVAFYLYLAIARKSICWNWKTVLQLLPLAICYPIAFFTFQACGLLYVTSAEAGILTAMAPILTAILAAVCIKERTNFKQYAAITLSVAGVIYITTMKSGTDATSGSMIGYALILMSCCASAGYTIFNRVSIRSLGATEITFYLMLAGVLFFMPISIGNHIADGKFLAFFVPLCNTRFIVAILFLGLFSSMVTTLLASVALKRLTSAQFAVFLNLSTVVAIVAGWLLMKENIQIYHIIGTSMILVGVVGMNLFQKSSV